MRAATFIMSMGLLLVSNLSGAADPPVGREYTGRTEAVATAAVRPRVTGELIHVAVKEGAEVAKGDLLAEVDPRQYRIDLDEARARAKAAEAKWQAAKLRTANARKLMQNKVVSQDEVALNEAPELEAQAGLAASQAEVERAELKLSFTKITAPFDATVSRIRTSEGNLVLADQTHILTVVATDRLHVSFEVPEADLLQLRRNKLAVPSKLNITVGFAGDEGYPHAATLDLIEPEVDPKTGTARMRATLANPHGLISPGMFARVRLSPASQ